MASEAAQGLGTLGFLVGLVAFPRLLPATGFGVALGAVVGEALHLLTETKVKGQATTVIPWGRAALILAYPRSSAQEVARAVTRADTQVTGEAAGHHVQALRGALAGAQQQMAARQPRPSRPHP